MPGSATRRLSSRWPSTRGEATRRRSRRRRSSLPPWAPSGTRSQPVLAHLSFAVNGWDVGGTATVLLYVEEAYEEIPPHMREAFSLGVSNIEGFKGAAKYNWAMKQVYAFLCATPTDWNKGHALHHASVGNMDQDEYDWGETIFNTVSEFHTWPKWKQVGVAVLRWPPVFFAVAAIATWWVKLHLPFEIRPSRKSSYRFMDKVVNFLGAAARYYFAWKMGALACIMFGDYFAMSGGILLFHWQHVFNPAYLIHKGAGKDWNRFDASIVGSSILTIPECLKWVTLGIEYVQLSVFETSVVWRLAAANCRGKAV